MALPSIAPFPPLSLRRELIAKDWDACLDAWIALTEAHLQLSSRLFAASSIKDKSLVKFLLSFLSENKTMPEEDRLLLDRRFKALRRNCFLLLHRSLCDVQDVPESFLQWRVLADLCSVYRGSQALTALLASVWKRRSRVIEPRLLEAKAQLVRSADVAAGTSLSDLEDLLTQVAPLLQAAPDIARLFMVGSELIDALSGGYGAFSPPLRRKSLRVVYSGFLSLMNTVPPNYALLFDHLYGLLTSLGPSSNPPTEGYTLLVDLIAQTPLCTLIQKQVDEANRSRARALLEKLRTISPVVGAAWTKRTRSKLDKGKQRAADASVEDESSHSMVSGMHVHRMSLITQLQDLFPDLGTGYVHKLLDAYDDDVEQVTAHLLDDSLPPHLADADRSEELHVNPPPGQLEDGSLTSGSPPIETDSTRPSSNFAPRATPPPPELHTRRNISDNDELDNLTVDASRLHLGRKNARHTADDMLDDKSSAPNKAAILAALAAFDSDDDERDDTYDVADVGGTVDSTVPGASDEANTLMNEEALFSAHKASPALFNRDAATRRGPARAALKAETGMTDEAIEGWAVMLGRDPRAARRLEAKYATFTAQQKALESTAWRAGPDDSEEGSGDGSGRGRGRDRDRGGFGAFRGRGRGAAGGDRDRGTGAGVGPAPAVDTQVSRQRKEAHKGSRANHNRRDQRAKKMGRGMGP
ncbi:MAG: hypothetical protein M1826_000842 [Phylliscum demangeonii]|nr:MAG: hypothetical protein M1826_000842 [Phylliscum demangeonii]